MSPCVESEERWAVFPYFPLYEVSTHGRVRRIVSGKIMSRTLEKDGYAVVTLIPGHKQVRVCRAVALTHIPNPDGKSFVNHIDGVRSNDNASNLEWVTAAENTRHSWNLGLSNSEKLGRARRRLLTDDQVRELRGALEKGGVHRLAKQFGINRKYASQVRTGRSGNYKWVK